MNIFSKLFGKSKSTYQPSNRLESLFNEAGSDPSKRPEFLRTLFHFDLICLGSSSEDSAVAQTAQFRTTPFEGADAIFAFTSVPALSWYLTQKKLPPCSYISMKADVLFRMIQDRQLGIILNAGHDCTKYFDPKEITEMLGDFGLQDHSVTMPAGQEFFIGQPTELPKILLENLDRYSKSSPKIKEIYFGLLATKSGDFRYLGIVDFEDTASVIDQDRVFQDLFTVTKETLEPNKVMDYSNLKNSGFEESITCGALKAVSAYNKNRVEG